MYQIDFSVKCVHHYAPLSSLSTFHIFRTSSDDYSLLIWTQYIRSIILYNSVWKSRYIKDYKLTNEKSDITRNSKQ